MAHRKGIQVVCPDCGGRAEVRLEASGTKHYIVHSATKCKRNLHGVSIAGCPGLIGELLQASLSLRLKERHGEELVRKKSNGATGKQPQAVTK